MQIQIDFQRVALNIRRQGVVLETASVKCGRHRGWLSSIARGDLTRIEFHDALALLDYHLQICGEAAHLKLLEHKS